jgi:hypothetical protein
LFAKADEQSIAAKDKHGATLPLQPVAPACRKPLIADEDFAVLGKTILRHFGPSAKHTGFRAEKVDHHAVNPPMAGQNG